MNSIQKSDKQDYYDICRKILCMIGQWPNQRPYQRMLGIGVIITWTISVLAVQIAQFCICETTQCILQTLPFHLITWIALVKLLTCYFNNRRIKHLIEQLYVNWNIFDTQEEWEIMRKYATNGRFYALVYATYSYVCALTFGASMLFPRILDTLSPLNESRPIIMLCPAYYFVDETKYFCYIFFHLQVGALLCITGVVVHDCTFLTYVEHACGLFTIVGFATLIEKTFSSSFAIQILITVIVMSSSLRQISAELDGDMIEVVKYVVFVTGQLLHLLMFCYEGQKLTNHSLETHAKIYNGLWYHIPLKSQRLLLLAMRKSAEIFSLSAGKIYIFSLESFTSVLKTSVSYFTVLSSFNE